MKLLPGILLKGILATVAVLSTVTCVYSQDWNQIIKASAGDRQNKSSAARTVNDSYGCSVSVSGNYAIVGAVLEDEDGSGINTLSDAGAAYILYNNEGIWTQIKKLVAPVRSASDYFGNSVSISGDYAIVGAYAEDEDADETNNLSLAGSAYIFKKDQGGTGNWGLVKKITAPVRAASDWFGYSVSISGDYAIVGASQEDEDASDLTTVSNAGSAYIFKKGETDSWTMIKKIVAPARAASDSFGYSVSISGDYAIVGAPNEDEDASDANKVDGAGSAYIFKKGETDSWTMIKKIVAPARAVTDRFAISVSISGDYAIVGADAEDEDASDANKKSEAGSAYIFKKGESDSWTMIKKIVAPDRAVSDNFGCSVSISGDYAIVGANREDEDADDANTVSNAGSGYIFKKGESDSWTMIKKIVAPARTANDFFGLSVSISGDYALVGVSTEDEDASEANTVDGAGSAYIFKQSQGGTDKWGFYQKTVSIDLSASDNFGYSVSISGDYAIVGAPNEDEDENGNIFIDAGAAYILHNNAGNWTQIKKLVAPVRAGSDNFGRSVSISGDYIIIGAYQEDEDASDANTVDAAGSAYIFKKGESDSWTMIKKIVAPVRAASDNFGFSVSISGDYAVVGAYQEDEDASDANTVDAAGSAYVFKKGESDSWTMIKKIVAPVRAASDYFGNSVSISGDYAIVGAYQEDEDASDANNVSASGSAYIFKKGESDSWTMTKKIVAPARAANDYFGYSVSVSDSYAIVGAYQEDEDAGETSNKDGSGSAYIFKKDQGSTDDWGLVKKIVASDRGTGDRFGSSVSISGNYVIVGAFEEDEDANETNNLSASGSAYIFKKGSADQWNQVKKITASTRAMDDNFGFAVSIGGDYAIIGAHNEDEDANEANNISNAGSAYVFKNTVVCPANVSTLIIPTTAGTYQSTHTVTDGALTHYCDCVNDYLLLTLDETGSGAVIPEDGVKVKVGTGASFYATGTGFVNNPQGAVMFNRWWAVNPTTAPTSTVKVRSYYTADDYDNVNDELEENSLSPLSSETKMFFYKVTDSSLGEFPEIEDITADKVKIITNDDDTPSVTKWVSAAESGKKYAEFLVSSFSGGGGGGSSAGSSPLPVTLVSFKATKAENHVRLGWATSAETNSDYFELQKSTDAHSWYALERIPAARESSKLASYFFIDTQPFEGQNLYRLKMTDKDGSFAYSRIQNVSFASSQSYAVYPNPVSDVLYFSPTEVDRIESVSVLNSVGQRVMHIKKITNKGVSIRQLPAGLYTIHITKKDTSIVYKKILVAR